MGTLINAATIILGGVLGLFLKGRLSERVNGTIMQGVGLVILLIGLDMARQTHNAIMVLISLVAGGIIGETLNLEGRFEDWSDRLQARFARGESTFSRGFVAASLLFCVGPMAIMGAFDDGLRGNYQVLVNKAALDGISSIALAASLGFGVVFSAIPVFLYQGSLTLLAVTIRPIMTPLAIAEMTATGGLMIVGLAFNMLGFRKIKVTNFLPALVLAVAIAYFWPGAMRLLGIG
ncbi:MAG: DUF554 domain-containing protein [Firmicutes bacterium]|nr:DUF554 domain-containing protein [Bacillota bacterium]